MTSVQNCSFFFSSRRRHTRLTCDWSSDVCSSDLYHFFVPGYSCAPNAASEPQNDDVNPTGMLGAASLKGWTRSPVSRWKRLMSPQGVFHVPKLAASLSEASASDCRRTSGTTLVQT